jgi:hypothetical protein
MRSTELGFDPSGRGVEVGGGIDHVIDPHRPSTLADPVGLRRVKRGEIITSRPDPPEVVKMCHERWTRRERQREQRFDEELRYLLDERERSEPPTPVVERVRPEEPADPERLRVEAATRA